ncbi:MAG: hypothetical protein E7072_02160 [Bacteroidales bacterium]|nr:hypothetical protein [Bacteroidales bacterium]
MVSFWDTIVNWFDSYVVFISAVRAMANIAIFYVFYTDVRKLFWRKVELSCGTFKIRQKHFTVQNVTNVVSLRYYGGGLVPDDVRKEILKATCPKVKEE